MFKKIGGVVLLAAVCVASVLLLNCGNGSSRPAGLLYVVSQAENNISTFSLNLYDGDLSLINSNAATCLTLTQQGAQSCGISLDLLLDPSFANAFLLNAGAFNNGIPQQGPPVAPSGVVPQVYGYGVNSDGSFGSPTDLTSSPNPPVVSACGQVQGVFTTCDTAVDMIRDTAGQFLFVATSGNQNLPSLVGGLPALPPMIYVFSTQGGTATALSQLQLTRVPTRLSVITYTPQGGSSQMLLFVSSNLDLTAAHNDNELSVYLFDPSSGSLTEQPNSPYTTQPNPQVVMAVNTNPPQQSTGGVFVYVGAQGAGTGNVAVFQLCTVVSNGGGQGGSQQCTQQQVNQQQLLPVGNPVSTGQNPVALIVDPTSSFLYVASSGTNQVFAFTIDVGTGALTASAPASVPTGANPVAMAMHVNYNTLGEFLYTSNYTGGSITGITVNAATGSMSSPNTVLFIPGQPYGVASK